MKKIISFILTLAMVMSLSSVPVFAAEITSTDEGNNSASQSVTATYIPEAEKAAITGVSVTVDGQTYSSGTVTLTPNSGSVTITVNGTNLSNLNADNNKLLYADGSSVGVSEASGWTVNDENTEASKTFELSTFQNCTTAFEIKYSNDGGSTYVSSGVYIVYQNETVSVAITWGAMNFTYSDDQVDGSDEGWTCETGANTVKVENSGDKSIVAGISYKQAEGYTAISGTFDKNFATIAKDGNAAFTLTLSGKPDAKLNGATIGTVTVAITDAINVASADDLKTALTSGGKIKLGDSFTLSNGGVIAIGNSTLVELDLNGKKLETESTLVIREGSMLTLSDNAGSGQLLFEMNSSSMPTVYAQIMCYGALVVDGGSYENKYNKYGKASISIYADGADVTINGGTIDSIDVSLGKLTVTGGYIGTLTCETKGTVEITGGTFGFDPTDYVDTDNYYVTNNDGTYTVTAK